MAETELGAKSQRWKHEGQLDWMAEVYEYDYDDMTPLDIVTAFALHRVEWRHSDTYDELVESHREEVAGAKETRRQEREAAKAEKAEAETNGKGKAKASKAKGKAAPAAAKKASGAKKTAAKATAKSKPAAQRRRGAAAKATKGGEDEF